eukprot:CAMPEP_0184306472 /NCGR_PEP_ID=MMETSP1049-20130417/15467_1 /TAXON_ID=77928 /ORGANISM="Proteomonas sulcata, Strain CCMP704" /LENGTH=55 /DNA_ID=CAMNT_0026618749 /DNA_START=421 /DNA_END=588 /DNA_ORIENTATION=-
MKSVSYSTDQAPDQLPNQASDLSPDPDPDQRLQQSPLRSLFPEGLRGRGAGGLRA